MVFDDNGQPVEQGLEEVRFLMMVPRGLPRAGARLPRAAHAGDAGAGAYVQTRGRACTPRARRGRERACRAPAHALWQL